MLLTLKFFQVDRDLYCEFIHSFLHALLNLKHSLVSNKLLFFLYNFFVRLEAFYTCEEFFFRAQKRVHVSLVSLFELEFPLRALSFALVLEHFYLLLVNDADLLAIEVVTTLRQFKVF